MTNARMGAVKRLVGAAAMVALGLGAGFAAAAAQEPGATPGGRGATPPKPLPLESARKAEFTATKGTWISLDVSPDGKTIVFDLLGDLYTMPMEGGKATRITSGLAYDAQPRYSPDGGKIVFVSDRSGGDNVWTLSADMKDTTQVTQGNNNLWLSPEWSPDGKYIVASRSGGLGGAAKLFVQHVDGHSPMALGRIPASQKTIGAAWSPDGRYVWYAGASGDWTYNAQLPQYQLFRYDRETGASTQMTSRYGSAFRPAVSPDGKFLVYGTREGAETGLRARNIATGEEDWLAYPVQRDDQESRAPLDVLPGYSFTPDSKAIVVSYGGEIWRVPMDRSQATKIPFEAEVKAEIGPEVKFAYRVDTTALAIAKQIRSPVESPDGRTIAFTAFDRLYVKTMPDGAPRRVSDAQVGEYHPSWSPDGKWLAYVTWDEANGGQIMKVAATGQARPVPVTRTAALYYNVAWSPDSRRLVASRGAARDLKEAVNAFGGPLGGQFVWVPAEGGTINLIAPTGSRDFAHFRADEPERIYAYSPFEGLVSFRWDGTDGRQHLRVSAPPGPGGGNPLEDEPRILPRRIFPLGEPERHPEGDALEASPFSPADLVVIAPKGDYALAQVGNDIYTVMVPHLGGPTPTLSVANVAGGPVPMRKLTDVGGEFASWSADGTRVNWAIGNAFLTYDLSRVKFIEDSTKAAARARADTASMVRAKLDTLKQTRAKVDSLTKAKATVPDSLPARRMVVVHKGRN
jgi:Tol biopolymer transport system component